MTEREYMLAYHLISMLYQLHGYMNDTEVYKTSYNADAKAVWYLKDLSYVDVIQGTWPNTKFLTYMFTEKARNLIKEVEGR